MITYAGMLKSMNANIPFVINSANSITHDRVFSTMVPCSCWTDTPNAAVMGTASVMNAPTAITH